MNTLEHYIVSQDLDPTQTMDLLQNHGIISDNCIQPQDVGNGGAAVAWLEMQSRARFSQKTPHP